MYDNSLDNQQLSQATALIQDVAKRRGRFVFPGPGFITFDRGVGFLHDKKFMDLTVQFKHLVHIPNYHWNLYTAVWAAYHCINIPGNFVELGVYKGMTTAIAAAYLDFQNIAKKWYLYDTFSGIPDDHLNDKWSNDVYSKLDPDQWYNEVRDLFKNYPNVEVIRGKVPDSFSQALPEKIAFMHIDMNSAKAELDALERLFDRVSPGGMILFDDYGWPVALAQRVVEDKFMQERNYMILELPTGQGLVIKR